MKRTKIFNIAFSSTSVFALILSFYVHLESIEFREKTLREQRREYYRKWDNLLLDKGIPLDIHKDTKLTKYDRSIIRGYWNNVCIEELRRLKIWKVKPKHDEWKSWELDLTNGITHNTVLQEFCYYKLYEDISNCYKNELVQIVERLYHEKNNSNIDYHKILKERDLQTVQDTLNNILRID